MKKSIRNGEIECWRWIFCLAVFLFHLGLDSSSVRTLCPNGQIGVEFFFVLSGLFMAKAADSRRKVCPEGLGKESLKYVVHKYTAIFPYHVIVFTIGFIRILLKNDITFLEGFEKFLLSIPQFFLIHLAGLHKAKVVSVEWYLSAMLIAALCIYPLLRKFYDTYIFVAAPLISLSILGYMYKNAGSLLPVYEWAGVTTTGVLRGIASMNLGCLAYEIAKLIQQRNWNMRGRVLLSLVCLAGYGCTIYYAMSNMGEKVRFTLVLFLMVSVAISYSDINVYGKYMNHDIFRFMGKLSLPFYLNTNMVRGFMKYMEWNQLRYRYFIVLAMVWNLVFSIGMVMIVEKIRKMRGGKSAPHKITSNFFVH